MTVQICDRCGDVTANTERCRCATPYDPVEVRRRHRDAVARAETTSRYALAAAKGNPPLAA